MSYPILREPAHAVLDEIAAERARQDAKWGQQNHPDGTAADEFNLMLVQQWKDLVDKNATEGESNWNNILFEEAYEAAAETDPAKLRAELVQIAAVAVAWIECIDRRAATGPSGADRG